jgi:hypothetical protein
MGFILSCQPAFAPAQGGFFFLVVFSGALVFLSSLIFGFLLLGVGMDDEDEVILPRVLGGSCPGKTPNIDRDRHGTHERMMRDYFSDTPVYGPSIFQQRYRIATVIIFDNLG